MLTGLRVSRNVQYHYVLTMLTLAEVSITNYIRYTWMRASFWSDWWGIILCMVLVSTPLCVVSPRRAILRLQARDSRHGQRRWTVQPSVDTTDILIENEFYIYVTCLTHWTTQNEYKLCVANRYIHAVFCYML